VTWLARVLAEVRADVAHGGCKAHPSRVSWAPHVLRFHPQEHHDTLVARGVL